MELTRCSRPPFRENEIVFVRLTARRWAKKRNCKLGPQLGKFVRECYPPDSFSTGTAGAAGRFRTSPYRLTGKTTTWISGQARSGTLRRLPVFHPAVEPTLYRHQKQDAA